jgi:hypothetical protein
MAVVTTVLNAVRIMQSAALALGAGKFNGNIEVVAIPVDVKKLTFHANVKVFTGDATTPFVEYSPCNDNGEVKTFVNVDDILSWLNGAYIDILSLKLTISDYGVLTRVFTVAKDVLKDAIAKKALYTKKKTALDDNLVAANLDLTRMEALGYNAATAHQAETIIYQEALAQKNAIVAAQAYYTGRVTFYQSVITP